MNITNLTRWSAGSLIGAGIASAALWLSTPPIKTFVGAEVSLDPLFTPSQFVHVLGALLTMFGYIGLYLSQRREIGWLGFIGFILAFVGAVFFLSDGIIALVVFPAVARASPALLEATGALFTGRALAAYIVFAATNTIGIVVFGVATWRAAIYPRVAALLFIVGGIMFNLPPGAIPHLVLVLGGVIWGMGAVWLGYSLWARAGDWTPGEAGS